VICSPAATTTVIFAPGPGTWLAPSALAASLVQATSLLVSPAMAETHHRDLVAALDLLLHQAGRHGEYARCRPPRCRPNFIAIVANLLNPCLIFGGGPGFALVFAAAYVDGGQVSRSTLETAWQIPPSPPTSIDPGEVAKFSAIAAEWWDPGRQIRPPAQVQSRPGWALSGARAAGAYRAGPAQPAPVSKACPCWISAAAAGCLSEPMARLGFAVTGADASDRNIGTAHAHAPPGPAWRSTIAPPPPKALAAQGLSFDVGFEHGGGGACRGCFPPTLPPARP